MKNAIITIALVFVAGIVCICQLDVNQMERQSLMVKNTADHMADAAGVCLNLENYSNGYITFNYDTAVKLAKEVFTENLGYTESYMPANAYFTDSADIEIYFFDQSLKQSITRTVYIKKALILASAQSFPHM